MNRYGEERPDKARQESEPLDDDTGLTWEGEEVFDDHVEPLALKPRESLEHRPRASVHPSLIHVHGHEPVQQRGVRVRAPAGVIRHRIVGRIEMQPVPSR